MDKLHYLTVQDFLWISQELTKKVQKYNFATLEEAVFSQYSYGSSVDLTGQAARLVKDLRRLKPFAEGNEAIAFVGLAAFLESNHQSLTLTAEESLGWIRQLWANPGAAKEMIASKLEHGHPHGVHGLASVREVVAAVLSGHGETVAALLKDEPARALAAG
jgi:prophage maintenance system killer protein